MDSSCISTPFPFKIKFRRVFKFITYTIEIIILYQGCIFYVISYVTDTMVDFTRGNRLMLFQTDLGYQEKVNF